MVATTDFEKSGQFHSNNLNSSESKDIVIEKCHGNGVVELQLNRPRSLNAFSPKMYLEAASILDKHSNNSSVRIIVITASGRNFCAGMDIREASQSKKLSTILNSARTFMFSLMNCNRLVIASVFGSVTGIGVTMLVHCDLVFSHPFATFQTAFPTVGMIPEYASSYLLPNFLGLSLSSKLLLQNKSVSAQQMQHAGVLEIFDVHINEHNVNHESIQYAIQWSKKHNDDQWVSILEAKSLIRKTIREKATQAIETEFESIHKMNDHGALKRLLASKYKQISSKRRAML